MNALPPDCPVTALGYSLDFAHGERRYHFRAASGEHAILRDGKNVRQTIDLMFDGHLDYLDAHWPAATDLDVGFSARAAHAALTRAAIDAGRYLTPVDRVLNRHATPPGCDANQPDAPSPGADSPDADASDDSRAAGWHCGNGALQARAVLTLIERNAIRDAEAIEAVSGLVYEAGPDYAARLIADMQVPF